MKHATLAIFKQKITPFYPPCEAQQFGRYDPFVLLYSYYPPSYFASSML